MKKITFGLIVILCIAFASVGTALANSPSDIEESWAKATITSWIDRGLVEGYADGSFKPNQTITRAEVAALINRAFDYSGGKTVSFADVKVSDWYYKDVIAASAAGFMSGYPDGTFQPKARVSRQELAVITAQLLKLSASESYVNYEDTKNSPEWSKGRIGAVIDAKVMGGYPDQTFQPNKLATRAEVVVIVDKAAKLNNNPITYYYNKPGTYGPSEGKQTVNGNVVVNAPGVTLQNLTIRGDLLLGASIGEGEAFIHGVTVKGSITVEGGGENSIHVEDSVLLTVIVNKQDDSIRIVIEGTTTIQEVVLQSGAKLEEAIGATGGGFNTVTLSEQLPEGTDVELVGSFETVDVKSKLINVSIPSGSIKQLNVGATASNTNIDVSKDATIVALVLDAIAKVVGQGQIDKATINMNGSSLEKKPTSIVVKVGVEVVIGGEKVGSTPVTPPVTPPVTLPPVSDSPSSNPGLSAAELAATAAVVVAETSAAGLEFDGTDTQEAIDAAQADQVAATALVTALSSNTVKSVLTARLSAVQGSIDDAQTARDAVIAATASVGTAEATAADLEGDGTDTQVAIDGAQAGHTTATALVTALPSSTAKTALSARLAVVQTTIDGAQATFNAVNAVETAETKANGLADDGTDTQEAIDEAQAGHTSATALVTALPSSTVKTALDTRLAAVLSTITSAQNVLDAVLESVIAVAISETKANGLAGNGDDTQLAIDETQADHSTAADLVTELPDSTAKTALVGRLLTVQSKIGDAQNGLDTVITATASVVDAESSAANLGNDGADTQVAIDGAQSDRSSAADVVTELPNSSVKTGLESRLSDILSTITSAQNVLNAVKTATTSVDTAETKANGLAGDGTDAQSAIDEAQEAYDTAVTLVGNLPIITSGVVKTGLESRLSAVQTNIDGAQATLDAVNAVEAAELKVNGLEGDGTDEQSDIDGAQEAYDAAVLLVIELPSSTARTALDTRLAGVLSTITSAQNVLDAVLDAAIAVATAETKANGLVMDGTDAQSAIDEAQADHTTAADLVTELPISTAKTELESRLSAVQTKITNATNMLYTMTLTTQLLESTELSLANGLRNAVTDQGDINGAIGYVEDITEYLPELPDSTVKAGLVDRLTVVNAILHALDTVVAAQTTANGLAGDGTDTQVAIDGAQAGYASATALVNALPSSIAKTGLELRLTAVQSTIDGAQDVLDAVVTATASVVIAEATAGGLADDGTDTQGAIDAAQDDHTSAADLVAALPSSTVKTELANRLTAVQSTIDGAQDVLEAVVTATALVVTAEATADGLAGDGTDTQGAIDAAQYDHTSVSDLVTLLPGSTVKSGLVTRLIAVQATIDGAQDVLDAVVAVHEAEDITGNLVGDGTDTQGVINTAQSDYDIASGMVTALPSSITKSELADRLIAVQVTIDGAQDVLDAVNTATQWVITSETVSLILSSNGTSTQVDINSVQNIHTSAETLVTGLPSSTAKTLLSARLAVVKTKIDGAQDARDAVVTATASVVTAEATAGGLADDGTDTQGAIDTAQDDHTSASDLVTALPSSTVKTDLANRLTAVQATIDGAQDVLDAVVTASALVVTAEATADGLAGDGTDTQGAIDTAEVDRTTALDSVNALPNSTVKTDLVNILTTIQSKIDAAQGALNIVTGLQAAVDSANALTEDSYRAVSWTSLQTAMGLSDSDLGLKAAKTLAINNAIGLLEVRIITSVTVEFSNPAEAASLPIIMSEGMSHYLFIAKVKDQDGFEMTTEGVSWSMSGNLDDDLIQNTTDHQTNLGIRHNSSSRTVILKAVSLSNTEIEGTYGVQAIAP